MIRKRNVRTHLRSYIFLTLSTLIMLIGGGVTLLWQMHREQSSRADGGNIVGQPSLPASTVDAIFARVGSPMAGTGKVVEQVSAQTNVDDAFALAVWWTETNDGAAGVGRTNRNPGGVRGSPGFPSAYSYTMYPSYAAAVTDWFNVLNSRYVSRGLTSAYTICYPYVGTSSAASWADKVVALMLRYRGSAPPVTPTPKVSVTPPSSALQQTHGVAMHPVLNGTQQTTAGPLGPRRALNVQQRADTQGKQQNVQRAPLGAGQDLLIGLALLCAAALALWGMKLRRGVPVPQVSISQNIDTVMAYPPLFSNEFSPVIERSTTELLPFPLRTTAALSPFPAVPASPITTSMQLPFPTMSVLPAAEVEQLPFPATSTADYSNGLLAQYRNFERPHHVVPVPSNTKEERSSALYEESRNPVTEGLPSPFGVKLPVRKPEPVSVSSGGLLRRYGNGGQ
ncbi:MAG: glucosaminidase domain-containing protein [Chloroflexi bacterium]|nr:glucosaminidase domain-containing protein [Chloroflexota bacterium]